MISPTLLMTWSLDYPPDEVEDILDELDEADEPSSLVKGLSPTNAGWLAHLLRKKCSDKREKMGEEIEKELQKLCPPREVRNFRVIRFKDYRTSKRPGRRTGQMTVWDVLSLGENTLQEGRRFLVTNIVPGQPGAWSHHDAEAEAFFNTRRDSRWKYIPQGGAGSSD